MWFLSYVQKDATLLDVTCCVRLHTLLHVVAQSLKLSANGRNNVGQLANIVASVRISVALQVLLTCLNGNEIILRESIVVRFTRLRIATVQNAVFVVLCFPGGVVSHYM